MGEAKEIRLKKIANDVTMKKATQHYWKQITESLRRSCPELGELEVRKITPAMCQDWAGKLSKAVSATRYNNSVSFLHQLFEASIKLGARVANPAQKVKRVRAKSK